MKKLIFSLLITTICSLTALDVKPFKKVRYNLETGQLSWIGEQLAWDRKSKHDFCIKTPWLDYKKLEINISQLAHIAGIVLSIRPINPNLKPHGIPGEGKVIGGARFNIYNVPTLLFCTYRLFAGQWPLKVDD